MAYRATRRQVLGAAGVLAVPGCSAPARVATRVRSDGDSPADRTNSQTATTTSPTSGGSGPPSATHRLPLPLSPDELRKRTVSGGVGKDDIPSIDFPRFVGVEEADQWLADDDVVFGVVRNGEVKAYPQRILVQHEICNDRVGGDPVSVTYCPLTGTVIGFLRGETTFGVSGRLLNNNLVMYDRHREQWWPQVLATAIPSPWSSTDDTRTLREFRVIWTTWERWKQAHPDTKVLDRQTGLLRNYAYDPYGSYVPARRGYYRPDSPPMVSPLHEDERYPPKKVVLGARSPEGAVAFLKDALREKQLLSGELGETPHLAVYDRELDTGYVYRNPHGLSFEVDGGEIISEDGSTSAPDSLPLVRVHAFDAMWFAWYGFYPETGVYE